MHDCNDRPFLGVDDSTCSDYRNFIDPMIVNPLDIHTSASLSNNSDIISSNPTIGSSINESTFGLGGLSGCYSVCHGYHVHLSVDDPINIELLGLLTIAFILLTVGSWREEPLDVARREGFLLGDMGQ